MNPDGQDMLGLDVAHVWLLSSFTFCNKFYPCTLVHWFSKVGDSPDEDTGMWAIHCDLDADESPATAILHIDTMVCTAHLISVYGKTFLLKGHSPDQSLLTYSDHTMSISTLIIMVLKSHFDSPNICYTCLTVTLVSDCVFEWA